MSFDARRKLSVVGAALVFGAGVAVAQQAVEQVPAEQAAAEEEGRLIQIGPDKSAEQAGEATRQRGLLRNRGRRLQRPGFVDPAPDAGQPAVVGRYWIGLGGVTTPPEVRAHVDTGDSPGVLVREVVPGGPAAAAGVEPMDILTHANNQPLGSLAELAEVVGEVGQAKGKIVLEFLRKGRPQTVFVTPEWKEVEQPIAPRPLADPGIGARGRLRQWLGERLAEDGLLGPGGIEQLLEQQLGQLEGQFGVPLGGGEAPAFVPQVGVENGVSVSITRQGNGPAQVTVRRNNADGETDEWRFDSDDQEAIAQLPDDVRPTVERMLGGMAFAPGGDVLGDFRVPMDGDVQQRLQQMEQQLDRFRQQFQNGAFAPGRNDPLDGAPRLFGGPPQAEVIEPEAAEDTDQVEEGPTELVIPAE